MSDTEFISSSYATWQTLIKARVKDAIRRSITRGCGENSEPLLKQATLLLKKQLYLCAICGQKMTRLKNNNSTASLDRVFSSVKPSPTRKTMCTYLNNCRWVCWSCNHKTRHCHMPNAKYGNKLDCVK